MLKKIMTNVPIIVLVVLAISIVFIGVSGSQEPSDRTVLLAEPYYALKSKGDRERRLKNYSDAFTYYQMSIALNRNNPYPYEWMAYMYNEEGLFLPSLAELNNARQYSRYFEDKEYDSYNLDILEAYINFKNNNFTKAQDILLKNVLGGVNSINRLSEAFSGFDFSEDNQRKYLKIFGDTYLIMLYLKCNYTLNYYEKDKGTIIDEYGDNTNVMEKSLKVLKNYTLDLQTDIELNTNISKIMGAEYKEELVAYLVIHSGLDTQGIYLRKYKNILRDKHTNIDICKKILDNPFLIHDFENY